MSGTLRQISMPLFELHSIDNGDGWLEDNEDNNVVSLLIIIGFLLIIVFNIPNRLPFRHQNNDDASILPFFFYVDMIPRQ